MNTDAPVSNTALILLEGRSDLPGASDLPTHKVPAADLVTVVTLRDLTNPNQPVTLDTSRQTGDLFRIKYALCQVQLHEVHELSSQVYSGDTLTHEGRLPVLLGKQDQQDLVIPVERKASLASGKSIRLVTLEGIADWASREVRDPELITEVTLIDITYPSQPVTLDKSRKTGNQFEIKYALCQLQPGHAYQLSSTAYLRDKITHVGSKALSLDGNSHQGLLIEMAPLINREPRLPGH